MQEIKGFGNYLGRCFMKWLNWIKPTSSFWAKFSLASTFLGALFWLLSKWYPNTSLSQFANVTGFWGFWAGLTLSIAMLIFWAPYKVNQEDIKANDISWGKNVQEQKLRIEKIEPLESDERDKLRNPQKYVFPYVRDINAYAALLSGENYVLVNTCFPSALSSDVVLKQLSGRLHISGIALDLKPQNITIVRYATQSAQWNVNLTKQALDYIKKAHTDNSPIKLSMHLEDMNDKRFCWDTPELTTLMITKTV